MAQSAKELHRQLAEGIRSSLAQVGAFEEAVASAMDAARMVGEMRGAIDQSCAQLDSGFAQVIARGRELADIVAGFERGAKAIRDVEGTAAETEAHVRAAGAMAGGLVSTIDSVQAPIVKLAQDLKRLSVQAEPTAGERFRARATTRPLAASTPEEVQSLAPAQTAQASPTVARESGRG